MYSLFPPRTACSTPHITLRSKQTLLWVLLLFSVEAAAQPSSQPISRTSLAQPKKVQPAQPKKVQRWIDKALLLGPVPAQQPIGIAPSQKAKASRALTTEHLPWQRIRPQEKRKWSWFNQTLLWHPWTPPKLSIDASKSSTQPHVAWIATWLHVSRYVELTLHVHSAQPFWLALNRKKQHTQTTCKAAEKQGELPTHKIKLKLAPGGHRLWLKSLLTPSCKAPWQVRLALSAAKAETLDAVRWSTQPSTRFSESFVIHRPKIKGLSIAPNGKTIALSMRHIHHNGTSEQWTELRTTRSGRLLYSWRGLGQLKHLQWSPDGRYLSFSSISKGKKAS
ncbi:MAG: WD40 repeat domain-containing protein, partial [Myxococcota bacterium]